MYEALFKSLTLTCMYKSGGGSPPELIEVLFVNEMAEVPKVVKLVVGLKGGLMIRDEARVKHCIVSTAREKIISKLGLQLARGPLTKPEANG